MKMPADCLLTSCNGSCLLLTVFKVIKSNKTAASSSVCQSFLTVFFHVILFFILSFPPQHQRIFPFEHIINVLPRADLLHLPLISYCLTSVHKISGFNSKCYGLPVFKNIHFVVFQVLNQLRGATSGPNVRGSTSSLFQPDLVQDFDPNILLDDLREGATPPVGRRSSAMVAEGGSSYHHHHSTHSVQMAARMVCYIICT
jgi:hypothetical protein